MKKTLDNSGRIGESSGKFTEPRQKEVSGSFDSALDEFVWHVKSHVCIIGYSADEAVRWCRFWYSDLWQEAITDPRVTDQPLSIKSISKQVETHQSAKRHSWWNT